MDEFALTSKLTDIERRLDSIESPSLSNLDSPQHQIEDLKFKIEELERKSAGF